MLCGHERGGGLCAAQESPRPHTPAGTLGTPPEVQQACFPSPLSLVPPSPFVCVSSLESCISWRLISLAFLVREGASSVVGLFVLQNATCVRSIIGRGSGVVMSLKGMKAALAFLQTPFLDIWRRGHGQLDLLGVPFASLKEQVDNEVGLAGKRRAVPGGLHVGPIQIPTSGVRTAEAAAAPGGPSTLRHASQVTQWALPALTSRL